MFVEIIGITGAEKENFLPAKRVLKAVFLLQVTDREVQCEWSLDFRNQESQTA